MICVAFENDDNGEIIYYGDFNNLLQLKEYAGDVWDECTRRGCNEIGFAVVNISKKVDDFILELLRDSYSNEPLLYYVLDFQDDPKYEDNLWFIDLTNYKDKDYFTRSIVDGFRNPVKTL